MCKWNTKNGRQADEFQLNEYIRGSIICAGIFKGNRLRKGL